MPHEHIKFSMISDRSGGGIPLRRAPSSALRQDPRAPADLII